MVLPHDTRRGTPHRSGYRKWRAESTDPAPWAKLLMGSQSGRSVLAGGKATGTKPNGSGSCSRQAKVRQAGAVRETSEEGECREASLRRRGLSGRSCRLRGSGALPHLRPGRSALGRYLSLRSPDTAGQYHEPRWVAWCVLHHRRLHRRGAQVDAESDRRCSHGRGDQRRYPLRRRRPLRHTSPGTEVLRRDLA